MRGGSRAALFKPPLSPFPEVCPAEQTCRERISALYRPKATSASEQRDIAVIKLPRGGKIDIFVPVKHIWLIYGRVPLAANHGC